MSDLAGNVRGQSLVLGKVQGPKCLAFPPTGSSLSRSKEPMALPPCAQNITCPESLARAMSLLQCMEAWGWELNGAPGSSQGDLLFEMHDLPKLEVPIA